MVANGVGPGIRIKIVSGCRVAKKNTRQKVGTQRFVVETGDVPEAFVLAWFDDPDVYALWVS